MYERLRLSLLMLALWLGASGCVIGPRFTRCPGEGGRGWVELDSEHYTLRTDLPPEQAREAMGELERMRIVLLAGMWPSALRQPMAKLSVYVLADWKEFKGLYPRRVQALYHRSETEALIVLSGPPSAWARRYSALSMDASSRLNHELAHYLSSYVLLRQPLWLSEGLAEYLETAQLTADGRSAVLGVPNKDATYVAARMLRESVDSAQGGGVVPGTLAWEPGLNFEEQDRELSSMYAGSWALVHWLIHERAERFAEFQTRLSQGMAPDEALRGALPELAQGTMDQTLWEYLRGRPPPPRQVVVPPTDLAFVERTLEDAEVHATRSKLAALGASMARQAALVKNRQVLARKELDEALRIDPQGLPALAVKSAEASREERLALARTAVRAHPDDSGAWLLLGAALESDEAAQEEREAAYKKALSLEPRSIPATKGLAWLYVTQGRSAEALPLAQWAVSLAPWSPSALDTLALALAGQGRCEEAIQLEHRALGHLREQRSTEQEHVLRERLAKLADGSLCKPSPP
ncbi:MULTISPECIES: DUF1570 domain-containing protein [unclassified Myxococcus]|uniref:DUF1570 domain-containing protein n=1 Tax=unclassified Myxococcus TaxID=2648731 RepID=UPI001CC17729